MKNIKSKHKRRWVMFKQRVKDFFFKLFAVRKITKIISKTYYNLVYKTGKDFDSIFMVPDEFKKYSNEQIERALDILVKYNKLASWNKKTQQNEDGYLVVLPTENRSQRRILNNIPEEIDLNNVKTEPVEQKQQENIQLEGQPNKTTAPAEDTPTNNEESAPAEQNQSTPTKHKSIWDDED